MIDLLTLDLWDKNILYLLIFVSAVEGNEELTTMIKEKTNNFENYNKKDASRILGAK